MFYVALAKWNTILDRGRIPITLSYFAVEKGRQNFSSNVILYPCERSHQSYLVKADAKTS